MKQKDIILYASLAGGAYLAYWYVTNYGPTGEKSQGHPSYWDVWFGGVATTMPGTQAQPGTGTMPSGLPAAPNSTPTTPPPTDTRSLKEKISAASGNKLHLNAHQWNYYRNAIAPPAWTGEQMAAAFPGDSASQMFTVDQFLAAAHAAGLAGIGMGAIVPTRSMSTIPSMTFGGSMKTNMMAGMMQGGMKGPVN